MVLQPLTRNSKISIINAEQFLSILKNTKISKLDQFCSLDVKSLFTSVPTAELLDIVKIKLQNDPTLIERTSLSIDTILNLVKFSINSTYFQFKDKFYKQKLGLAMGSSLSPVLAEIFMQYYEEKLLKKFPKSPVLIVRYVDDYFVIYRKRVFSLDKFLECCNSIHPSIQLTIENEKDGQIPFLDLMITRSEGKISTAVYRKPTSTNITLHSDSNHSFSTKFSVACSMFRRAYKYCSDKTSLDLELKNVNNILSKSCYSKQFIQKAHNRIINPLPKKAPEQFWTTIVVPYIPGLSEKFSQSCSNLAKVRVAFKTQQTLRSLLMHVKPKCEPALRNCVYRVPCADCASIYIGQTKRHAPKRLSEHDDSVFKAFDPEKCDTNGYQLAQHAHELGHKFDWAKASAIKFEPHLGKRLVLESIAIQHFKNVISQASHQLDKLWHQFFTTDDIDRLFSKSHLIPDAISTRVRRTQRAR
jgi:hypothetical protein